MCDSLCGWEKPVGHCCENCLWHQTRGDVTDIFKLQNQKVVIVMLFGVLIIINGKVRIV